MGSSGRGAVAWLLWSARALVPAPVRVVSPARPYEGRSFRGGLGVSLVTAAAAPPALDAGAEFTIKIGLIDALRGVAYGTDGDVVSEGLVDALEISATSLRVVLEPRAAKDEAVVEATRAAAAACRDALVAEGLLRQRPHLPARVLKLTQRVHLLNAR